MWNSKYGFLTRFSHDIGTGLEVQVKARLPKLRSLSLHMRRVAHQARAYPGFRSMKRLGIFLLHPGWDASPSQGYPQH